MEHGVSPRRSIGEIYESVPFERKKLKGGRARACSAVRGRADDRVSYLLRGDFEELGVGEEFAEGVIDELRAMRASSWR